jgi:hypothetical protein
MIDVCERCTASGLQPFAYHLTVTFILQCLHFVMGPWKRNLPKDGYASGSSGKDVFRTDWRIGKALSSRHDPSVTARTSLDCIILVLRARSECWRMFSGLTMFGIKRILSSLLFSQAQHYWLAPFLKWPPPSAFNQRQKLYTITATSPAESLSWRVAACTIYSLRGRCFAWNNFHSASFSCLLSEVETRNLNPC